MVSTKKHACAHIDDSCQTEQNFLQTSFEVFVMGVQLCIDRVVMQVDVLSEKIKVRASPM